MKYSPEVTQKIIDLIKGGNFASVAYGACGISKDTFYEWIKKYPDFSDSIKKAKDERIASLVLQIRQDTSWQSKAWILERLKTNKFHLPTLAEIQLRQEVEQLKKMIVDIKNGIGGGKDES